MKDMSTPKTPKSLCETVSIQRYLDIFVLSGDCSFFPKKSAEKELHLSTGDFFPSIVVILTLRMLGCFH